LREIENTIPGLYINIPVRMLAIVKRKPPLCRNRIPNLHHRLAAIDLRRAKIVFVRDFLLVGAVSGELVSGPNSLLTGKITGKNRDFGTASRPLPLSNPNAMRAVGDSMVFVAQN
jgi:hypothetical protein